MGGLQNWIGGDVKSWLVEGWTEEGTPIPSQQQVPGYEAPPTWSETGGDYCTPFTWSHSHFEKGIEMEGSLGKSELQDRVYFTSNCLTDLELTDSVVLTDTRISFFSEKLRPDQCYGFRSDIVLCADLDRDPHNVHAAKNVRIDRFEHEGGCADNKLVAECEEAARTDAGCTADAQSAWDDCQQAERRRKCDLGRRGPNDDKKCLLACPTASDPLKKCPDPSCNPMIDFGHGVIAPRDGVQRDTELGISDLKFYDYQFDANFGHATPKPQDPMMTLGLHSVVNFYMDNAISIANDPIEEINQDSVYFHRIYKYANDELQSGQEIAGGLFKSILIYQHDVITSMNDNTQITIIAFVVIMLVVILQLAFLSQRISSVVFDYYGMTEICVRFLNEIRRLQEDLNTKEQDGTIQKKLADKDHGSASEDDQSETSIDG
jgi:hypothetical protein